MEAPYVYQALTAPTSIRLLRLLPSTDPNAPLHGKLFEYNIEDFYGQPNSYEALSYVWGDPEPGYSISFNGSMLPITTNLFGALSHLRHRYGERLWWVDAICINQADDREKERQISLMYQIYACASCVIVWLGEGPLGGTEDGGQHVFEELFIARQKMLNDTKRDDLASDRIVRLFQRAWFRRIWVLQEVGAARRIQIHDGGSVMDGYAFSEMLDLLRPSLKSRPELQYLLNITQSAAYLMKQSIFRRPYQGPGTPLEGFFHFRQLIEMFHDREATKAHDKVFALLGMSSKDMGTSGLLPDYTIDFTQLFKRLVKFMISDRMTLECQGDEQAAVIGCTGYVMAEIKDVKDTRRSGHTTMIKLGLVNGLYSNSLIYERNDGNDEDSKSFSDDGEPSPARTSSISEDSLSKEEHDIFRNTWSIQATPVPVRKGDLVCLLDGAAHPTIIRVCRDYSVVLVAAVWIEKLKDKSESDQRLWCKKIVEGCHSLKRDFTLVWDWKYAFGSDTFFDTFAAWAESRSWELEEPASGTEKYLDDLSRRWDCALICIDGHWINPSEKRVKEVLSDFEHILQSREFRAVGETRLSAFLSRISSRNDTMLGPQAIFSKDDELSDVVEQNELTHISQLCCWAAEERYENVTRLLIKTKKVKATWRRPYIMQWILRKLAAAGFLDLVEWALTDGANADEGFQGTDLALQAAAEQGHLAIVERLLQANADVNAPAAPTEGRTALQAAAEQGHLAIVERLLEVNADVNAQASAWHGITALQGAAEPGHISIVERLIQANADVNAPAAAEGKTALQAAAEQGHIAIVELLFQHKAEVDSSVSQHKDTTGLVAAAATGHVPIVEWLLRQKGEFRKRYYFRVGESALAAAAAAGHLPIVEMLLDAKADANLPPAFYSQEERELLGAALEKAASAGHLPIVERLLKVSVLSDFLRGISLALPHAAATGHIRIVERLLDAGAVVDEKGRWPEDKTALTAAAGSGHLVVVEWLLQAGADISIKHRFRPDELHDVKGKTSVSSGWASWDGWGAEDLTAEQFARRRGHHAVAERLKRQRLRQKATIKPLEAAYDSMPTQETTVGSN